MPRTVKVAQVTDLKPGDSKTVVAEDNLLQQLRTDGLAIAGTEASLSALSRRQVDVLVMCKVLKEVAHLGIACSDGVKQRQ
jgi:hypothetical protein